MIKKYLFLANCMALSILWAAGMNMAFAQTAARQPNAGVGLVRALPLCPGDTQSTVFGLAIDGKQVPVAFERFNGKKAFHVAAFEMDSPVELTLQSTSADTPTVRPKRYGYQFVAVKQNTWKIKVKHPQHLVVEVNGQRPLFIFALPPEENAPEPDTPNTLYFGPGVHQVDELRVQSGQTVYLAAGALVKGRIYGFEVSDMTLRGRGVLDARGFTSREKKLHGILFERSQRINMEGIQLRTGDWWQCLFLLCDDINVKWLHTLSFGRNNDGVDTDGVTRLTVEDSFIGYGDDGFGWHAVDAVSFGEPPTRDCTAERCVIWNEHAGMAFVGHSPPGLSVMGAAC